MKKIYLIITLLVIAGGAWAESFVGPEDTPDNYNLKPPINESANPQIKAGGLWVGSLVSGGAIRIGGTDEVCKADYSGTMRYNTTTKMVEICSDSSGSYNWEQATGGASSINELVDGKTGGNSVFLGSGSGINDDGSDNRNTAVGISSLHSNTSGAHNSSTGWASMYKNTTGSYNVANGSQALYSNTSGYRNTANGYASLYKNTTGNYNVANGMYTLYENTTGYSNTANGYDALHHNTDGKFNTGNGYASLSANTTGRNNIGNGAHALYKNTTGSHNTANGYRALFENTSGSYNTAVGLYSLYKNTTSQNNTAVGVYSLFSNTTGYHNTAIGLSAGRYKNDGGDNKTSNKSVYLGYDTRAKNSGDTNEIVIGYGARGNGSNTVTLGNDAIANTYLKGNVRLNGDLYDKNGDLFAGGGKFVDGDDVNDAVYTTGNVGIGTTNPGEALEVGGKTLVRATDATLFSGLFDGTLVVQASGQEDAILAKTDPNQANAAAGVFQQSSSNPGFDAFRIQSVGISNSKAILNVISGVDESSGTGGSSRFYVRQDGNIGIGTTSPAVQLHTTGTARFDGGVQVDGRNMITGNGYAHVAQSTNDDHYGYFEGIRNDGTRGFYLGFGNGSSTVNLNLDNANRLDITGGDVNMTGKLTVSGTVSGATPTASNNLTTKQYVDDKVADATGAITEGKFVDGDDANDAVYTGGNVGIGLTNPQSQFEFKWDGNTYSDYEDIKFKDNNGDKKFGFSTKYGRFNTYGENVQLNLYGDNNSYYNSIRFHQGNNDQGSFTTYGDKMMYRFNEHWFRNNNGNDLVRIKEDGRVGIGTTSPAKKLDVAGDINFTGNLYKNGSLYSASLWTDNGSSTYLTQTGDNVGIGTTSPSAKFEVKSSSGSEPLALFKTTSGDSSIKVEGNGGEAYLEIANTNGSSGNTSNSWGIGTNDDLNLHFSYGTNGTMNKGEKVIIKSNGNVGIGVTDPSNKLTVTQSNGNLANSAIKIWETYSGEDNRLYIGTNTDGAYYRTDYSSSGNLDHRFLTYNTERVRIKGNGNVGIGTTSPSQKLDINGGNLMVKSNSSGYTTTFIANTGSGDARTYYDAINGDFSGGDYGYVGQNDAGYMEYNIGGNSPRPYHVFSGGNVGIGTTSPSKKLDVAGDINFTGNLYKNGSLYNASLWTDNGSSTYLTQTGDNVGIGTTSPTRKLDVAGRIKFGESGYEILSSSSNGNSTAILHSVNGRGLEFRANSDTYNQIVLKESGNVGIGTGSPDTILNIQKNTDPILRILGKDNDDTATIQLLENKNDPTYGFEMKYNGDVNKFEINRYDGSSTAVNTLSILRNNGNVGIGTTSPNQKLDVEGPMRINQGGSYDLWLQGGSASSGNDRNLALLGIKSSDKLVLNYAGEYTGGIEVAGPKTVFNNNVGIGTTSPSKKLDVAGDINFTGNLYKNGTLFTSGASSINELSDGKTGGNSVFLGSGSGINDDGSDNRNTAVGINSLYSNTTGAYNIAVGINALNKNTTGNNNTAVGRAALYKNTTGYNNVAIGRDTLYNNTTGAYNTANGLSALEKNTSGKYNTAIGYRSLFNNTTANYNVADGMYSLYKNTTGHDNTAIGFTSLYNNTTGSYNSAIGLYSGRYQNDGGDNETSRNSVYLGYDTRAKNSGDTNEIVIGYGARGNGSNTVTLGNDSIAKTILKGNVGIGTTSPVRKLDVVAAGTTLASRFATDQSSSYIYFSNNVVGYDQTRVGANGNKLAFATNYADRMTIDFNGNVGIGITSPSQKLQVAGNIYSTGYGRFDGGIQVDGRSMISSTGSTHITQYTDNNHYGYFEGKRDDGTRGFYLGFGNGSSTVNLNLDNANRLDITGGDVNMTGKLTVSGTVSGATPTASNNLTTKQYVDDKVADATGAITEGKFVDGDDANDAVYTQGNVGIGTTSPDEKLDVDGNIKLGTGGFIYGDTTNPYIRLNNSTGAILGYGTGHIAIGSSFTYSNDNGEVFRINHSNGNVGIGTNSPNQKLDVEGPMRINQGGSYDLWLQGGSASSGNDRNLALLGIKSSDKLVLNYAGEYTGGIEVAGPKTVFNNNVGIGTTSPQAKLDINGDIALNNHILKLRANGDSMHRIGYTSSKYGLSDVDWWNYNSNLVFAVGDSAPKMTLKNNGNVGIGTTSPSKKLDVAGDINFTGNLYKNGVLYNGSDYVYRNKIGDNDVFPGSTSNWPNNPQPGAYMTDYSGSTGTVLMTPDVPGSAATIGLEFTYGGDAWYHSNTDSNKWKTHRFVTEKDNGVAYVNGKLGVGTTSPIEKLHVKKTGSGLVALIENTDGDNDEVLRLKSGGDNTILHLQTDHIYSSGGHNQLFLGNGEKVVIANGNGNVGIGMSAPAYKLDVDGQIRTSRYGVGGRYNSSQVQGIWSIAPNYKINTDNNDFGTQYGIVYAYQSAGTSGSKKPIAGWGHQILFTNAGNRYAAISLSSGNAYFGGKVGVGTTSPSKKLDVSGDINFTGNLYKNGSLYNASLWTDNGSSTYLTQTGDNVGIGTTSPTKKLDVNGDVQVRGGDMVMLPNSLSSQIADTFSGNTYKSYIWLNAGSGSSDPGYIMHETSNSESNEGVLHLSPSDDNSYGDYVSIHGTNDPDMIKLHTSGDIEGVNTIGISTGAERIDFDAGNNQIEIMGGNVGIGTTSPSQKLTVSGNAYATGYGRFDNGVQVDGRNMINGNGYAHVAQSTDDNHYGYFEGRRNDGKRGFYIGWGNGSSDVNMYTDNANRWVMNEKLYVGGDLQAAGGIRARSFKTDSGEQRCPSGQVMVGFNTSGLICEEVSGGTYE